MTTEYDMGAQRERAWQIWNAGIAKAGANAAIKYFRNGRPIEGEELFQSWWETIDLVMEQMEEVPGDLDEWKKRSPQEKYMELKGTAASYESFVNSIQRVINIMQGGTIEDQVKVRQADKEKVRKIIADAFGRVTNCDVESGINLEPGSELMPSEKIVELEITEEKLLDSLRQDSQVISADCYGGEIFLNTAYGEISFRLVFGDETGGGQA